MSDAMAQKALADSAKITESAVAAIKPNGDKEELTASESKIFLDMAKENEAYMCSLAQDSKESKWVLVQKNAAGTSVYKKADDSGKRFIFKSVTEMAFDQGTILGYLWNLENKKKYDDVFAGFKIIADLDGNTQINYQTSIGMFPVQPRDFVYLAHWSVNPQSNVWVMSARTITCVKLAPLTKDCVRAEVKTGGFIIEPTEKPNVSRLTFLADADLKGSIPAFITDKLFANQPLMIDNIHKNMSKDVEKLSK
jgi:hypothetical protein